jgi:type I restriction enzyme S subunit
MSESGRTQSGFMPTDWAQQPLSKSTIKIQDGTHYSPKTAEGPFRYVTSKNVKFGYLDLADCGWISEREHNEIYSRCDVKYGDILLTKDGANTGNACLNNQHEPFSLLSSVALLRTDGAKYHPGFLLQYLLSPIGQRRLKDLMSGNAISRLTLRKIKAFETPIAPPGEQRRIAEMLGSLDQVIEQTEALIAKYQQIKAGLMHDLFTRGVTSDGRLRPRRPEAPHLYKEYPIGWIPQDWPIRRLGDLAEVVSGVTLGSKEDPPGSVQVPYLRVANVQDGYLDLGEIKTVRIAPTLAEKLLLRRGDVLMNEGGDFDKLGRGTVWNDEISPCVHQNHVFRVRPNSGDLRSTYLALWSQSEFGKKYFVLSSKQSTNLASINSTQLKRFLVALPSPEEQRRIESRLSAANLRVEAFRRERDKMSVLKDGLVHDLLTGRIRVNVKSG